MKSFKIIVRNYNKKDGSGTFLTAKCKGKYIPLATCEEEVYYTIRFANEQKLPTKNGIYEISFNDGDLWLDTRPEVEEKHIVRVRPVRVVFDKNLVEKDIRG